MRRQELNVFRMRLLGAEVLASLGIDAANTSAPSRRMRKTFNSCRRMSSVPMYTTHSKPSSAHTVAVATPAGPRPSRQSHGFLPMRSISKPCPRQLLILCAPVCSRSSRLR